MDNDNVYLDMMSLNDGKFVPEAARLRSYGDDMDESTAQWIHKQLSEADKQGRSKTNCSLLHHYEPTDVYW